MLQLNWIGDDALESDIATPAREIASRHRIDRRLLLPYAARRGAIARNATSYIASKPTSSFCRKSNPRSVAVSAINAVAGLHNWRRVRTVAPKEARTWCTRTASRVQSIVGHS